MAAPRSTVGASIVGPTSALALKLAAFTKLSEDDRHALARAITNVRTVDARRDLTTEGERPRFVHVILEGWASAYKTLPDGKRQIVAFFVPGDFCDLNVYVLRQRDHSIGAVSRLKVAMMSPDEMASLTVGRPRLTQALWWEGLVTAAIQREWMLNLGQRTARERIAHLLSRRGAKGVHHITFRGSSASRSPSPMKLMAMTVRKIAPPANSAQCGAMSR